MGVAIGYRISGGEIKAPRPRTQVTQTFDGVSIPWNSSGTNIYVYVDAPTEWQAALGQFSSVVPVRLVNSGTTTATVEAPVFTDIVASAVPVYANTTGTFSAPPWSIDPGQSKTFGLKYIAYETGVWNEAIFFSSDESSGGQRYDVSVVSGDVISLSVSPSSYSVNTTKPNENFIGTYTVTVLRNGQIIDLDPQLSASIVGSPAWSIERVETNSVTVRFDSARFNNIAATYVSTLTISSGVQGVGSKNLTNSASHLVNNSLNYSSSTWMSTLTQPDVIVGARIDYVQSSTQAERVLTIGVGSGADGSQPVRSGIYSLFDQNYLNPIYGVDRGRTPYPFWQTVYSFRLNSLTTGSVRTYLSKDHRVKTQQPAGFDYDSYFGYFANSGTMFVVELDLDDNVKILFNDLRETTGGVDAQLDQTLERLGRAFYYYSIKDTDLQSRSTGTTGVVTYQEVFENGQLVKTYALNEFGQNGNPSNNMTKLFVGFDGSDNIKTILVESPR